MRSWTYLFLINLWLYYFKVWLSFKTLWQRSSTYISTIRYCVFQWTPGKEDLYFTYFMKGFSMKLRGCLTLIKRRITVIHTAWEVSVFGVFVVRIFSRSDWIWGDTWYLPVFSQKAGKSGPENSEYGHFSRSAKGSFYFHVAIYHWFREWFCLVRGYHE